MATTRRSRSTTRRSTTRRASPVRSRRITRVNHRSLSASPRRSTAASRRRAAARRAALRRREEDTLLGGRRNRSLAARFEDGWARPFSEYGAAGRRAAYRARTATRRSTRGRMWA